MWTALKKQKATRAAGATGAPPASLKAFVPAVLLGILLTTAGGGLSCLSSGYLPTFMKLVNHVKPTDLGLVLSAPSYGIDPRTSSASSPASA